MGAASFAAAAGGSWWGCRGVAVGSEQVLRGLVRGLRCGVGALEGEPLAGVVGVDDSVPTLRAGGVAAELDDVGEGEPVGNQPAAPAAVVGFPAVPRPRAFVGRRGGVGPDDADPSAGDRDRGVDDDPDRRSEPVFAELGVTGRCVRWRGVGVAGVASGLLVRFGWWSECLPNPSPGLTVMRGRAATSIYAAVPRRLAVWPVRVLR